MPRLLKSAKFWTAIIDLVACTALYFVGKYAATTAVDDVRFVIFAVQPVFGLVIAAFCAEDVAEKAGGQILRG